VIDRIDFRADLRILGFQNRKDETFPILNLRTQPCQGFPLLCSVRKIAVRIVAPRNNLTRIDSLFKFGQEFIWRCCVEMDGHLSTLPRLAEGVDYLVDKLSPNNGLQAKSPTFLGADRDRLEELISRARDRRQRFEIKVVQPGISKALLSPGMAECLGATRYI
jgi:hypothetical protein